MKKILMLCIISLLAFNLFAAGSGETTSAATENEMPKEITVAIPALPATIEPGK